MNSNALPPSGILPRGADVLWSARAPGRINLIGEHVDYNDGWVLPMAIAPGITIRAARRQDWNVSFTSSTRQETIVFRLPDLSTGELPPWGRYIYGVLQVFTRRTGTWLPGFHAQIDSDLPEGAGLSSSAALEAATMTLLEKISGHTLPLVQKALLCREAEHTYAGVPCGFMDQMASVLGVEGHLLLIDCATLETRPIPMTDERLVVIVANTGVSHALADGAYAQRRDECEDVLRRLNLASFRDLRPAVLTTSQAVLGDTLFRRARHVVTENDRTRTVAEAMGAGDWNRVGAALYASHESLATDYEVSCPELDCLVDTAHGIGPEGGVIGARMTGAGFGGSTVTLAWEDRAPEIIARYGARFQAAFGREPVCFTTRPGPGAM